MTPQHILQVQENPSRYLNELADRGVDISRYVQDVMQPGYWGGQFLSSLNNDDIEKHATIIASTFSDKLHQKLHYNDI